jgi:glycerol 2-dehydrogenase (NADP+)
LIRSKFDTPPSLIDTHIQVDAQLEIHLYNPQHKLLDYLKSKNIVPQAYCPLGSTNSPLLKDETVVEIAAKHSVSCADVLLGWLRTFYPFTFDLIVTTCLRTSILRSLVKKDLVVLPKSVTPSRITSNLNGALAVYAKLETADVEKLDGVAAAGKQRRLVSPPWGK